MSPTSKNKVCDSSCTTKTTTRTSRLRSTTVTSTGLPSSHFRFHPIQPSSTHLNSTTPTTPAKKLVVLYAWLFAPERHLDKFRAWYHTLGYDVLSVRVHLRDFFLPKILSNSSTYDELLFHGFSIGVYLLGEVMLLLEKREKKSKDENDNSLKEVSASKPLSKLTAIIMDSPVDVDWAPTGVSLSTTSNRFLQWVISGAVKAHLRLFYHLATKHYNAASEYLRANPRKIPIAMLHSKNDLMTNWEHMFAVQDRWRAEGTKLVVRKCWESSPHASHFYRHPVEYRDTVETFLKRVAEGDFDCEEKVVEIDESDEKRIEMNGKAI
ncbi:hypothetical protein TYRP_009049 [Tyrophagus putrescentiae]|nr:hypothetical protein TYRP_009049 [Tyrophagus putrescentiae]